MSSIRSILEKITARSYCTGQDGQPYNEDEWQIDQALLEISQIIDEVIGEDETVISQHYMAGNIEERTAFPDRRNRLRAEQRNRKKELLK